MEEELEGADFERQLEIVDELNVLTGLLSEYSEPLEEREDIPFDDIVAEFNQTPEQLYAAADELTDHESRIRRQLDELESRIDELRARERLEDRSRELAFEESFFEEGQGTRYQGPFRGL